MTAHNPRRRARVVVELSIEEGDAIWAALTNDLNELISPADVKVSARARRKLERALRGAREEK